MIFYSCFYLGLWISAKELSKSLSTLLSTVNLLHYIDIQSFKYLLKRLSAEVNSFVDGALSTSLLNPCVLKMNKKVNA